MRQQTTEERAANPTTFGYARFPLSATERTFIDYEIELFEFMIRRILGRKTGAIATHEFPKSPWEGMKRDNHLSHK
ncbi:MAG: hypothetical protein JWP89_1860 [Schlesneria sp.]|nr:hypothetical protein [Schlesneria sp.]